MKTLLLSLTALAALCLSFSKTKKVVPPGTVQVSDSLFADETEISNAAWLEYEQWTKTQYGSNSKEHIATLPDTLVWREKISFNEPYVLYYYRHPAYKNFPVVGVSYDQAVAYCEWRTARVKASMSLKKNIKNQTFEYRLPTKAEWEKLAETSAVFLTNDGKNSKGQRLLNCVHNDTTQVNIKGSPHKYPDVLAPVYSYWPNALKIFNTTGNAAEMVMEKGICKGGGWRNSLEDCRPGKDATYTKPTAWLGFRCVCVVRNS